MNMVPHDIPDEDIDNEEGEPDSGELDSIDSQPGPNDAPAQAVPIRGRSAESNPNIVNK
ncbi:MAG: hypothetical protein ABJA62_01640 [Luteimonas sp.]